MTFSSTSLFSTAPTATFTPDSFSISGTPDLGVADQWKSDKGVDF